MADIIELETNLSNYKQQLQQVDAALLSDVGNPQLIKLHGDLQEVVNLTVSLLETQLNKSGDNKVPLKVPKHEETIKPQGKRVASQDSPLQTYTPNTSKQQQRANVWKVGDKCSAVYEQTKMVYDAVIVQILSEYECKVKFENFGNTETIEMSSLKRRTKSTSSESDPIHKKAKREIDNAERELKKKKAFKKAQRMKDLDTEREQEKNKWKSFNTKVFSKTSKGKVKKSIFATPEDGCVQGHVGVGTCGTGGKPMTKN